MAKHFNISRSLALLGLTAGLLLAGCAGNQYGPPLADGKPRNYGQQRYLENQEYQQQTLDRMNLPN